MPRRRYNARAMEAPPVRYVTTSDGYNIAHAVSGEGRPFVFMPQPISHLEVYWREDTWVRPWLDGLASRFSLIQYDGRGQGMSTRGLSPDFSLANLELDLEAVVDGLAVQQFILMAVHSSGHVAIRYAARHSERVEALVLISCGLTLTEWYPALLQPLAEQDWDAYLRAQAGLTQASDLTASIRRQKDSVTQSDWLLLLRASQTSNVADELPHLRAPVLVLHPRDSLNLPQSESLKLAAAMPGAQIALIDGATPLGSPVQGLRTIDEFLAGLPAREASLFGRTAGLRSFGLSQRQVEVLRLIAQGKTNREIAEALVLSERTVQRHVADLYAKLDVRNRAEATAYALKARGG